MAMGLVCGLASSAIFKAMVRGTERNMPTEPKAQPQKTRDTNTTRVDKPSP